MLPWPDPQVEWWGKKIYDHIDERSSSSQMMRHVGSLVPTNRAPTCPKGCRNKAREQRVKFQDSKLMPAVPRVVRYPLDMEISHNLDQLTHLSSAAEIRALLASSFLNAWDAVTKAAQAREELCKKTKALQNNPDAEDKVKKAKICTRDALLWRWFGLTGWIYNQAESEFFHSYGREIESQLVNSVAKIGQRLMQDLMRRPCWYRLERLMTEYSCYDEWSPEISGLFLRLHTTVASLGGVGYLAQFKLTPEEEEELREIEKQQELEEQAAEEGFEADVWENAHQKVSDSVVGFLGLDDCDDYIFGDGDGIVDAMMGEFQEVDDADLDFVAVDPSWKSIYLDQQPQPSDTPSFPSSSWDPQHSMGYQQPQLFDAPSSPSSSWSRNTQWAANSRSLWMLRPFQAFPGTRRAQWAANSRSFQPVLFSNCSVAAWCAFRFSRCRPTIWTDDIVSSKKER